MRQSKPFKICANHLVSNQLSGSILPVLNPLQIQWCALDEINAGVCDGMTNKEIKKNMPEEYESRKKDKLRLEPAIIEIEHAIAYDNRDTNGGHWGSRETIQTHGLNLLPHIFKSVTYNGNNDNDNTTGRYEITLLSIISVMQIWGSLRSLLQVKMEVEKFAPDLSWYIDVILQLIDKAGDFASDDIWLIILCKVSSNMFPDKGLLIV
ncbi:hypothetical protein MKW98_024131 [Papaver atlanticum]|uniref:Uncharacterized protein n=1 Tax=Papaver atlanticum TaxID=357466 RepID=A0AAD4T1D6_9MAGN|nr:hypothetical protein MKW98_024131 [Papaver atlanticum]